MTNSRKRKEQDFISLHISLKIRNPIKKENITRKKKKKKKKNQKKKKKKKNRFN